MKHKHISSVIHKWIGLLASVMILIFCVSGLILNHRALFSSISVDRGFLPKEYQIENFNNGIIKGTIPFNDGVLAFGNAGIWQTDENFSRITEFNDGLPAGADNRNIRNVVRTKDGSLWCVSQFGLFRYSGSEWNEVPLPGLKERIADLTIGSDSAGIVVLSRSALYPVADGQISRIELQRPEDYSSKVTLFKTLWMLHSGELFGIAGRLIVDIIGLILIFICVSGIILFLFPHLIKRTAAEKRLKHIRIFKWQFKWHDKIGYVTLFFTILIAFTGMCLRPPLMIPSVMIKTAPMPGSELDSENVWQDKLRGIRWDALNNSWLISTSEGFIRVDESLREIPRRVNVETAPPVSPMGINVFEPLDSSTWLVGSFSGMYIWKPAEGDVRDYFTQEKLTSKKSGRPTSDHLISGFSKDLSFRETVFDYSSGSSYPLTMPGILRSQPMSLWNFALELHVGRCYTPFLGPFSSIFIFLAGAIMITVLITGLILHKRLQNHKQ